MSYHKNRDLREAEVLLKRLLLRFADPHANGQMTKEQTEEWEAEVEQLLWHIVQAAADAGRGIVRS